jgi:hypothetical protein
MEPLRPVVDRAVLSFLVQRRSLHAADWLIGPSGVCRVHPQLARVLVQRVDAELAQAGREAAPARASATHSHSQKPAGARANATHSHSRAGAEMALAREAAELFYRSAV